MIVLPSLPEPGKWKQNHEFQDNYLEFVSKETKIIKQKLSPVCSDLAIYFLKICIFLSVKYVGTHASVLF